ncbi:uncharacterized protein [Penaeus vannamei]|uniref:uncharacterized protein n=1 Tax=Penaeus vannamei TaxID=6689 RepID=UPI00387F8C53
MDKTDYKHKLNNLLSNGSVDRKVTIGNGTMEAARFKKKVRDLLLRSARGKGLLHLLEEVPRNLSMRGLPKVHKPGVPMRPITSGIGSAPHRLAKCLAKPLSAAMGVINDSHLKDSGDLIRHLQSIHHFISLMKLCVDFGFFEFAGEEYQQITGLAMGSPLSAVLACLFMETLERDRYKDKIGRHSTWLRYVDDVLVIVPRRSCLHRRGFNIRINEHQADVRHHRTFNAMVVHED